jgi:crotonobetainyl-CoA:carnitine CoA-transferase CaiB-like acyl-CoA transferase
MHTAPSERPLLAGIRVIEVGQVLAGPYAGMLLADLGAEVIKIEPPAGDIARQVGAPGPGGHTTYFTSLNRNKRSAVIDLASDDGRDQLGRLAAESHALLVNMKASTIRKLGLTYDGLRRWNERLVCVAVTGYGLDGSRADRPAFDYLIQAETGVASMTGEPGGPPCLSGYSAIDNSAAVFAALGLVAGLVRGEGGQVDVSLYDITLSQLNYKAAAVLNGGAEPVRLPASAHSFYTPAQLFATADGHLAVFVSHDDFWERLSAQLGVPELASDSRFATMPARAAHRDELTSLLAPIWQRQSTNEWVAQLTAAGVPVGPVTSLTDAMASDFAAEREMVVTLDGAGAARVVGNPIKVDGVATTYSAPPALGEHTDTVSGVGTGTILS